MDSERQKHAFGSYAGLMLVVLQAQVERFIWPTTGPLQMEIELEVCC